MKFKLIALSATLLLISGCTVKEYREYDNLCKNLPDGFLNKDLEEAYNKEKGVYIVENKELENMYLFLLVHNNKWEFIELKLKENLSLGFPKKTGLYKIYRDYDFKNCLNFNYHKNDFKNINGDFCLAANKIKKHESSVIFDIKQKEINANTLLIEKNISFKNETFLKTNVIIFNSDSGGYSCEGNYYKYIYKGFS